jgi:hypothetical protein
MADNRLSARDRELFLAEPHSVPRWWAMPARPQARHTGLGLLGWPGYQGGEYVITGEAGTPVHPESYSDEFGRLLRRGWAAKDNLARLASHNPDAHGAC